MIDLIILQIDMKFFYTCICFLLCSFSYGQKAESTGNETQWWLGLKYGLATTNVNVLNSYSTLDSESDKKYSSSLGSLIGVEADFDLYGIVEVAFIPGVRQSNYSVGKSYNWSASSGESVYDLDLKHLYNLTYLEVPLFLKYDFINTAGGKIKVKGKDKSHVKISTSGGLIAFVQVGVSYTRLLNANTKIDKETNEFGRVEQFQYEQGVSNLFLKNNYNWMIGGGLGYDFQSVRLELDVNYKNSFHNVVNVKERYSDKTLVNDYYEVLDDLKFSNLEFAVRVLFPFKFIYSGSFKKI